MLGVLLGERRNCEVKHRIVNVKFSSILRTICRKRVGGEIRFRSPNAMHLYRRVELTCKIIICYTLLVRPSRCDVVYQFSLLCTSERSSSPPKHLAAVALVLHGTVHGSMAALLSRPGL